MPRDKDKEAKLVRQKTKQAVDLALAAKWREAIEVNKSILEIAPDDVDDAVDSAGQLDSEVPIKHRRHPFLDQPQPHKRCACVVVCAAVVWDGFFGHFSITKGYGLHFD
jgi:hypothetical protein